MFTFHIDALFTVHTDTMFTAIPWVQLNGIVVSVIVWTLRPVSDGHRVVTEAC